MKKLLTVLGFCLLACAAKGQAATTQPNSLGVVQASTSTFTGAINLFILTKAQIDGLIPSTTGQMLWCKDCLAGSIGSVCVSTEAGLTNRGFVLSTGTVCK